ncbi:hypothetical protein [Paraburkholderia sediminicola]|uniref:hypothetical protein n=1 Tax=Paraburkholderia sediminicola TaxID=458836 RepID=UPI0038BDB0C2
MKRRKFIRSAIFILPLLAGLALPPVSEAAQFNAQVGFVQVAADETQTECHVTIQGENGERVTVCKSEDGHGERVEGEGPMDRLESAFRIDTSQGPLGGPPALIPHAVDQINEVGAQIGRVFGW